jgi:penicillin-binding protein 1A
MARAFAVFGNSGRAVNPIAIRSVEDRNGRVVLDVERDIRQQQRRLPNNMQVISPQNAYIMTKILEKTVEEGTLANGAGWGSKFSFKDSNGKSYKMPMAGKTGTPQNWSDAWAVGYSPYYTTAIWFGFDKPGNSLGVELTGSTLAGPVWGDYMREIHKGLPRRDFSRPASGVIDVTVCAKSGLLRTPACNEGEVTLPFLDGTQPSLYCNIHGNASYKPPSSSGIDAFGFDPEQDSFLGTLTMPTLRLDLLPELREEPAKKGRGSSRNPPVSWSFDGRNPFLDDEPYDIPADNGQISNEPASDRTPAPADNAASSAANDEKANQLPAETAPPGGHNAEDTKQTFGLELPSWNPLLD